MAKGNFGERLKRERELREVSLEEITTATRIGPHFLEALENEEWSKLPGGVFNRGFRRARSHLQPAFPLPPAGYLWRLEWPSSFSSWL